MKKLYFISAICLSVLTAKSQTFWTEDFGTGCNQGQLASAYTGTNGAWTLTATGANAATANTFYIGAQEAGNAVGSCGSGCTGTVDATLHVGNVAITFAGLAADGGASYFSGVPGACVAFGICATTNERAESPTINCSGKNTITLSFSYMEGGDGTNDDATIWYYDGTTWSLLNNCAKTLVCGSSQGTWTAYSFALPASANNNANVKIGFNWTNNDDGTGTDPSFAVDNITLSTPTATGIADASASGLEIYASGKKVMIKSAASVAIIGVYDLLGRTIPASLLNNTISLEEQPSGIYFVRLDVKGKVVTKKVFIE